jgi:hypothetical protein
MFGTDYSLTGTTGDLIIPAGQTSASFQFNALTDAIHEKKETAKFTLSAGNGYKIPKKKGKSVTIKIVNVGGTRR